MGMTSRIAALWGEANTKYLASQRRASDVSGSIGSISKILRLMLQSGVLGGRRLSGDLSAGDARHHHRRLDPRARGRWRRSTPPSPTGAASSARARPGSASPICLTLLPTQLAPMALRPPAKSLAVENVGVVPPGTEKVIIQDISLSLQAGNGLGIIGPSGSGKSCLARVLVGVWRPVRGRIRLDGASLDQWSQESLGKHIGYLPQDVELMAGTVAQNIGRFSPSLDANAVIAAATAAGVHDADRQPARGLRDPGRRERHGAVGRPGAAHRARPRALRRSLHRRARRAELQSRRRGRRGARAAPSSACAPGTASSS